MWGMWRDSSVRLSWVRIWMHFSLQTALSMPLLLPALRDPAFQRWDRSHLRRRLAVPLLPSGTSPTPGRPSACREAPVHTGTLFSFRVHGRIQLLGGEVTLRNMYFQFYLTPFPSNGQAHWLLELCSPIDVNHGCESHVGVFQNYIRKVTLYIVCIKYRRAGEWGGTNYGA